MPASPSTIAPTAAAWPMPPLVRASIGLHLLAAGAAIAHPPFAGPALGAVLLDHAILTGAGLWPRCDWLGPNATRLPAASAARGEVAITIDDGPDPELTPAALDLLDRHGQRATFFCIGRQVAAHPALAREVVARGHDLQNHSAIHRHDFSLRGPRGLAAEIALAQRTIEDTTGRRPAFFRAPAGLRNPFLDPVLHRLGLRLVSWTRRGFDTRERDPGRVLSRLTRGLAGGDILLLHDGHGARDRGGRPVLLEVLPRLCDTLAAAGLRSVPLSAALPPRAIAA